MSEKNVVTGPALGERQLGLLSENGLNRSQPGTALPAPSTPGRRLGLKASAYKKGRTYFVRPFL
jgi:hypothetical protein